MLLQISSDQQLIDRERRVAADAERWLVEQFFQKLSGIRIDGRFAYCCADETRAVRQCRDTTLPRLIVVADGTNNEHSQCRLAAAQYICQLDGAMGQSALWKLIQTEDDLLLIDVVYAVWREAAIGGDDPEKHSALQQLIAGHPDRLDSLFRHQNAQVCKDAIGIAEMLNCQASIPALQVLLQSENAEIKTAATRALKSLSSSTLPDSFASNQTNEEPSVMSGASALVRNLHSKHLITQAAADILLADLPRRCAGWKCLDTVALIRAAFELDHHGLWFDCERDVPPYYPELLDLFADASNGMFRPEANHQITDHILNDALHGGFVVLQFICGHRLYRVRIRFKGDWCDVKTLILAANRAVEDLGCSERFVLMEPNAAEASIVFTHPLQFSKVVNELGIPIFCESDELVVEQKSILVRLDEEITEARWDVIRMLFDISDRSVSRRELPVFRNEYGRTALHLLCDRTHDLDTTETFIRFLISNGADVNAVDPEGNTPLHYANTASAVSTLVEFGADAMRANCNGAFPLHVAAAEQDDVVVAALLENVHDVDLPTTSHRPKEAVKYRRDWILEQGLAALSFSVTPTVPGQTPLHMAAACGNLKTATLLLNCSANIDADDSQGQTPLHLAISRQQKDLAALLIHRGANQRRRDRAGKLPAERMGDLEKSRHESQRRLKILVRKIKLLGAVSATCELVVNVAAFPIRCVRRLVSGGSIPGPSQDVRDTA